MEKNEVLQVSVSDVYDGLQQIIKEAVDIGHEKIVALAVETTICLVGKKGCPDRLSPLPGKEQLFVEKGCPDRPSPLPGKEQLVSERGCSKPVAPLPGKEKI